MLAALMLASFLVGKAAAADSEDKETWDEARAASCTELTEAYKETVIAERKVVAAIHDSKTETIATNVLGGAMLAGLGVGFFTWNDNESAEENLTDLRNDLRIIRTVSSEKKCSLPAEADIK
jgi:hypothetical protein